MTVAEFESLKQVEVVDLIVTGSETVALAPPPVVLVMVSETPATTPLKSIVPF